MLFSVLCRVLGGALVAFCCGAVWATPAPRYAALSPAEQARWQRLLFLGPSGLVPRNAGYYLSGRTGPDPADEYEHVSRLLGGDTRYEGPPDQSPWCRFPARFHFVARTAFGQLLRPEDLRACNLPLPALDKPINAYLQQHFERQDTGQALYHIDLLIEGSRFHNGSALTLKLRFGASNPPLPGSLREWPRPLVEAAQLVQAFTFASGKATVSKDVLLDRIGFGHEGGQQRLRLRLAPEQAYLLALLGIESMHANFPYSLRRINCHTYVEHLLRTVLPPDSDEQARPLFDYLPDFVRRYRGDGGDAAPIAAPHSYRPSLRRELDTLAADLTWRDYQALQTFLTEQTLPADPAALADPLLRRLLGKAAAMFPETLATTPAALELHDDYLHTLADAAPASPAVAPGETAAVPLFTSPHPSALRIGASARDDGTWLHASLTGFSTTAASLPGATPYGFTLLQFDLLTNGQHALLDRVLIVEQKKVGAACCNAALYGAGFRRLSGIALDLVNAPQARSLAKAGFAPELELKLTEGIGTVAALGPSLQMLPALDLLTYGKHVDAGLIVHAGWSSRAVAVSARHYFRASADTWRRNSARTSLTLDYRLNADARLELQHQRFDDSTTQTGISYVLAF